MPDRRRLHVVVFALWLLSCPFFLVSQPVLVGANASYVAVSDSMEPTIARGSVVFVESLSPDDVDVGDVVTFHSESGIGPTTTHRVVATRREGDDRQFVVKGDSNPSPDNEPIDASQLVGQVSAVIPLFGYVVLTVGLRLPILLFGVVPALALSVERIHFVLSISESDST